MTLTYYLRVGKVTAPFNSVMQVQVDGTPVQTITEPNAPDADYVLQTVNLSQFANGATHVLKFTYNRPGGAPSDTWNVDDVAVTIAWRLGNRC